MTYQITSDFLTFALLGWDSRQTELLTLDATHTLCAGYTGGGGSDPIQAVVVEHSNPYAPTVGTPVSVSPGSTGGDDFDLTLAPDGVTVAMAAGRFFFQGPTVTIFTWDGAMGLTVTGSGQGSPVFSVTAGRVCMPANNRVIVVTASGVYLHSWSGGTLTLLDTGPAPTDPYASTARIYAIDATHALIWESSGVELVDITGDVVTLPVFRSFAADFPTNVQDMGVRPVTTDPTVFRGYTTTAGAVGQEALYTVNVGAPSVTPSSGQVFSGGGAFSPTVDVDGITSLGIDVATMVVGGYAGSHPAAVLTAADYNDGTFGPGPGAPFPGGALDWPVGRVRNVGDGLLYVTGDGSGTDGFVVLYTFVLVPPVDEWTVGYLSI